MAILPPCRGPASLSHWLRLNGDTFFDCIFDRAPVQSHEEGPSMWIASGCYLQFWRVNPPSFHAALSRQEGPFPSLTSPSSRARAHKFWWLWGYIHPPRPCSGFGFSFVSTWSVLFASGNQTAPGCIQLPDVSSSPSGSARTEMLSLLQHNQNVPGGHCCKERLVGKHCPVCNGSRNCLGKGYRI